MTGIYQSMYKRLLYNKLHRGIGVRYMGRFYDERYTDTQLVRDVLSVLHMPGVEVL